MIVIIRCLIGITIHGDMLQTSGGIYILSLRDEAAGTRPGNLECTMFLEFFSLGRECPLFLLYGGGPSQVSDLREIIRSLATLRGQRVALQELSFITAVGECGLVAVSSRFNDGVQWRGSPAAATWALSQGAWDNVVFLLEPFTVQESYGGYQVLYQGHRAEVIYSTGRNW